MVLLRKSQVETFGLLIIVILIIFLALFFIRISSFSSNIDNNVKDSIIANNIVTSITKVTICEKQQLPSIIKNCNNNVNSCSQDSCKLLDEKLSFMMDAAGYDENRYKLTVSTTQKELLSIGNCNLNDANIISSTPYTIYLDGQSAILKAYLCS